MNRERKKPLDGIPAGEDPPPAPADLRFNPPVIADAPRIRRLAAGARTCDLAFAGIFLLRRKYRTQIAFADGFLLRRYETGRLAGLGFPCGDGDLETALRRIERAFPPGRRPDLTLVTDAQLALIRRLRPNAFTVETDPGDADYLYRREDLAEFPGAAFQAKRNHAHRFEADHPNWRFTPLTAANANDAQIVADAWYAGQEQPLSNQLEAERSAVREALGLIDELALSGGVVYCGDRPVAMSVTSPISPDVADVHFEKCVPDCRDAYPVICRETARILSCRYVNREEDLNVPGLRKSKCSYHPCERIAKHRLIWR